MKALMEKTEAGWRATSLERPDCIGLGPTQEAARANLVENFQKPAKDQGLHQTWKEETVQEDHSRPVLWYPVI